MPVMIKVSDIVILLVEKYKLTEEQAIQFVTSMFDVINEGLQDEKLVKLKGLGTFKVTNVNSRESVNVNSGERIVIEGRDKISFTPEAYLRDLVNGPFSQFETVVINDDVDFSDIDKKYEIKDESLSEESKEDVLAPDVASSDTETLHNTLTNDEENKPIQQSNSDTIIEIPESAPIQLTQLADLEQLKSEQKVDDSKEESSSATSGSEPEEKKIDEEVNMEPVQAPSTQRNEQKALVSKEETSTIDKTGEVGEDEVALTPTPITPEPIKAEEEIDEQKEKLTVVQTPSDNESPKEDENTQDLEILSRTIKRGHHLVKTLIVCVICMFVLGAIGVYYMMKQVSIRDHRIEYLEAQTSRKNVGEYKSKSITPASPKVITNGAEKDRTLPASKSTSDVKDSQSSKQIKKERQNSASSNDGQLGKSSSSNKSINKKSIPTNTNSTLVSQTYNKDPRVRTGAYAIVGISETVKVKKGQTINSISRAYFGPGMECYVEALNGKDIKEGQTVKIPKLQLKKHR